MPSQTDIGALYIPNWANVAWTQPGGKGTQVLPAQKNSTPWASFPVPGQVIDEVGPSLWKFGCGHGADLPRIFRDYDSVTKSSVAVVCCPICSFIQNLIEPYSQISNVVQFPIVIP